MFTFIWLSYCRKGLSLQAVSDTVVEELRMLLQLHPMVILTTKTVNLQGRCLKQEIKRLVAERNDLEVVFAVFFTRQLSI